MKNKFLNKMLTALSVAALAISAMAPVTSDAAVMYLPDVTEQMSQASYWSSKTANPDQVLADADAIAAINKEITATNGTRTIDLSLWTQETFDGVALNQSMATAAEEDAKYFFNVGVRYDAEGNRLATWEEAREKIFKPMIENSIDPAAAQNTPVKYAIAVNRTALHSFPSDGKLLDDPNDPDFDYQYQTGIRLNEPMVIKSTSADGKYYYATTSCTTGWILKADVAICADKEQWLSAWNFADADTLVVVGSEVYTAESNTSPETASRRMTMGTTLELAKESDWTPTITNRSAANNHVVWLPVRAADGSYTRTLALVAESKLVNEGYLPLTAANIATVALNELGETYGWGGMLGSNDCSGYVRDVYRCFGLNLARNTTYQAASPMAKYALSTMSAEEKASLIGRLPLGTVLFFNGHEMIYLGQDNGKLYVVSSVSSAFVNGTRTRIRSCVVNTLDVTRASGNTWLQELHTAQVPYLMPGVDPVTGSTGASSEVPVEPTAPVESSVAPSTEAPTQAPTTEAPTQAPTEAPTTEAPTTETPTQAPTEAPTTEAPTTQAPTTKHVGEYRITVKATSYARISLDKSNADSGETVTIVVTPVNNYKVNELKVKSTSGDDVPVDTNDQKTYTFQMPDSDVEISVTFTKTTTTSGTTTRTGTSTKTTTKTTTKASTKTTTKASTVKKGAVKTGDTTSMVRYTVLTVMCVASVAALLVLRRRRTR